MNIAFVVVLSFVIAAVSGDATNTTTYAEMSCTSGGRKLPNLVYAKVDLRTKAQNIFCDSVNVNPFNETYTFYYYDDPFVYGSCNNVKSTKGIVQFTEVVSFRQIGTTINVDLSGVFLTGPYIRQLVTTVVAYPTINFAQCSSTIGMELLTGTIIVSVVGGPTCNGIAVKKFCPGIHNGNPQPISVTIPGLGPIVIG